jgi:hypothetical protein
MSHWDTESAESLRVGMAKALATVVAEFPGTAGVPPAQTSPWDPKPALAAVVRSTTALAYASFHGGIVGLRYQTVPSLSQAWRADLGGRDARGPREPRIVTRPLRTSVLSVSQSHSAAAAPGLLRAWSSNAERPRCD